MRPQSWVGGVLMGALLSVTACAGEDSPQPQASPSSPTSSPTSETPKPEDEAAEAATAVVTRMLRVTDAAKKEPSARDWEPEIRQYAGDPAALLAVTAVRDYA